jgi:hypothetical protein
MTAVRGAFFLCTVPYPTFPVRDMVYLISPSFSQLSYRFWAHGHSIRFPCAHVAGCACPPARLWNKTAR